MSSVIFLSALDDALSGRIDFARDRFKALLVTASYQPDPDVHTRRSDISAEIFGVGYLTGGAEVDVTVSKNTLSERIEVELGGAVWTGTITAAGAVYYHARGGQADADELVAFIDFGANVASINGVFTLTASVLRIQN